MNKQTFLRLLEERILILDGGMGTMIQGYRLGENDYRGTRFADIPGQVKGNYQDNSSSVSGSRCRYFFYQYIQCERYFHGGIRYAVVRT